jgi:hypothetical protein
MKKTLFKIMITALSIVLIIAAMPFSASAEAEALGNESPFISAQFFDSNSDEVDGNSLEANQTYTVNLVLSGISNVAIFNLTASFTDDISITEVSSIADVENSGFEYGGYKLDDDNNKFVIVISTVNNSTYTELNGDTVMVTLTVETATDGDFADFFEISTDRNHTFIIANFEEGNEAAYVYKDCTQTETDFPFLDFDMSPSSSVTVTGTVKVATEKTGTLYAEDSAVANATISAVDASSNVLASTTTDAEGKFSPVVPSGAVSLTISTYCVPERTITLSGDSVDNYPIIPVIAVDYDESGSFGAGDKNLFTEANPDADLDGSGAFGAGDGNIFNYFMAPGVSTSYAEITL